MFLIWHLWLTTTNLSYRFYIFETSATASCGSTGNLFERLSMYSYSFVCVYTKFSLSKYSTKPHIFYVRISCYLLIILYLLAVSYVNLESLPINCPNSAWEWQGGFGPWNFLTKRFVFGVNCWVQKGSRHSDFVWQHIWKTPFRKNDWD